ncbi:hypothetical protein ACT3SP_12810 [Brachybacterium sp. AOP43-C2-M15]|uniref:hypothetical protein n=1 Tax=Brachybacterium sp. AOP43-C2-M15 TaxID=3457661 RepID=UPI00403364BD
MHQEADGPHGLPSGTDRRRRMRRLLARLVLGLLLVIALVLSLMLLRVHLLLPRTAQQEATEGYERASSAFADLAAADAAALDDEFGAPLGTSRTVACSVGTAEQGWFVVDHLNTCVLREVETRAQSGALEDSAARAAQLLSGVPAWQEQEGYLLSPDPSTEESGGSACASVVESRLPADDGVSGREESIDLAAVVLADPGSLDPCLRGMSAGGRALEESIVEVPNGAEEIDTDGGGALVVVRETRLSSTSLGCLPLPLFCEPATTTPRLPDLGS